MKVGYNVVTKEEYEKMLMVIIYLGEDSSQNEFLRFLEILFTNQLTVDEKKRILEDEYQIPVDHKMEGELDSMCNLSDRIEERAFEKGKRQGLEQGIQQGIEKGKMESVLALIQNLHFSFEEAVSALNLPDYLIETCRKYIQLNV